MNSDIHIKYHKIPYGELIIGSYEEHLCLCDWRYRKMRKSIDDRIQKGLQTNYIEMESEIILRTVNQLEEYFEKKRKDFDIPLLFVGSDFQKRVWNELLTIPYGKTESYLGLSKRLGDEKAIRAAATANGANAISIIVPCHRIIGSKGELTGYAGGLQTKKRLLELEGYNNNGQMSIFE
jgi:methylated-DNA-[protein]-cysteine S-methyltransferase